MIRGIKFVTVPVRNQKEGVKFYTEKLGFRLLTDQTYDEKQHWIELGIPGSDSKLVLFTADCKRATSVNYSPSRSGVTMSTLPRKC